MCWFPDLYALFIKIIFEVMKVKEGSESFDEQNQHIGH